MPYLRALHPEALDGRDELTYQASALLNAMDGTLTPLDKTEAVLKLLFLKLRGLPGWQRDQDPIPQTARVLKTLARSTEQARLKLARTLGADAADLQRAIEELCQEVAGMTPTSFATNLLRFHDAPEDLRDAVADGRLTYNAANVLAALPRPQREEALAANEHVTVRQARATEPNHGARRRHARHASEAPSWPIEGPKATHTAQAGEAKYEDNKKQRDFGRRPTSSVEVASLFALNPEERARKASEAPRASGPHAR